MFQGIAPGEFDTMLSCLAARTARYKKDEIILLSGAAVDSVGLILSGSVRIVREDADGNSTIIAELTISEIFGEVFACAGITQSPVTVAAAEDAEILFLNYRKIITTCPSACVYHARLIENMLSLLARKNLMLNQKIEILSKRTTREKLLYFFDSQRGAENRFSIPFNREELARYLSVDRSAMSKELCKMRDEGLLRFKRNHFELL